MNGALKRYLFCLLTVVQTLTLVFPQVALAENSPSPSIIRIGIEAGHGRTYYDDKDVPGALVPGKSICEADINIAVSQLVADILRARGYQVDIFLGTGGKRGKEGTFPKSQMLQRQFDAFVALHCDWPAKGASGYKICRFGGFPGTGKNATGDASDRLVNALWEEYGKTTGLNRDTSPGRFTLDFRKYWALNPKWGVTNTTPGAIIEMGFLSGDLDFISGTEGKIRIAKGVTDAIEIFLLSQGTTLPQNKPPVASISARAGGTSLSGPIANLTVNPGKEIRVDLSASNSYDPEGTSINYEWRVNDQIVYKPDIWGDLGAGSHKVILFVTDSNGLRSDKAELTIDINEVTSSFTEPKTPPLVIGMDPREATPGTTLTEWGRNFTPGGTARLHFMKPDGTEFPIRIVAINYNGEFRIEYTIHEDDSPGKYTWWAIEEGPSLPRISDYMTFFVTGPVVLPKAELPPLVIGMDPREATPGTTLTERGRNFTPNAYAVLHFRKPDGIEFNPRRELTNGKGEFSIQYTIPADYLPGITTWWAVDEATGRISDTLTFSVTRSVVLPISESVSVKYMAHLANLGWMSSWIQDGQTAGLLEGNQLEAIKITISNYGVTYRSHVAYDGWLPWVLNGDISGTTGQGKSLQAIEIKLQKAPGRLHIYYRVYVHNRGWTDWVSDGETAGTTGLGLPIEAIEIKLQSSPN